MPSLALPASMLRWRFRLQCLRWRFRLGSGGWESRASGSRPFREDPVLANVLVVGGAGGICSDCVRQRTAAGHRPVVLDNLVFGHRAAVAPDVPFHHAELGDEETVARLLAQEAVEVVMHFAA